MNTETYKKKLEKFLLKQEEKKLKKKSKKKTKKKKEKTKTIEPTAVPKKKVGRKKKLGRKKKRVRRKIVIREKQSAVFDYKIVSMLNGKQNGYIGKYVDFTEAYNKLQELSKEEEDIIFPRRFLNRYDIVNAKDEYVLLEKNRYGDKKDSMLRNDYGKFIPQKITNNKKWIIRDKIKRNIEETFWVYGLDPRTDRKTYSWIWDNLVLNRIQNSYDVIRFLVFKNKIIIRYDNEPLSMILCKNGSDAIRMYNLMSDNVDKLKTKQIVGVGSYNVISDKRRELENDIMELTGWPKSKIQRPTN